MATRLAICLRVIVGSTAALLLAAAPAHAQQLPLTSYTVAQGLSGNDIAGALEDPQGFLWIGTEHGLSRFDGKEFRTFRMPHGPSDARMTSLVAGSDGVLWVGVWGGVYRFEFARGGVFTAIPLEGSGPHLERTVLAIDRDGQLWCGADGLYRLEHRDDGSEVLRRVPLPANVSLPQVPALAADRSGNLWVAADRVYRRFPSGEFQQLASDGPYPTNVTFLAAHDSGRVWVTGFGGLWSIDHCPPHQGEPQCRWQRRLALDVLPWAGPLPKPDGSYWVGTIGALLEIDGEGRILQRIQRAQGLLASYPVPLLLDRRGDLWISFEHSGIQRLAADGFTSFGRQEGVEAGQINTILTMRSGPLVAIGYPHVFQQYDGTRFKAIRPPMPAGIHGPGWGWHQVDFQDRFGEWWIPTLNGVVRLPAVRDFEALSRTKPVDVLARQGCFRGHEVFRLYEDSHADVWIGTIEPGKPTLHRWNRDTGTIDCFSFAPLFGQEMSPTAFLDDGKGTLWLGFYLGQVARYRDGRFRCLINCGPSSTYGNITALLLDRRQRLWITTSRGGVLRLDEPGAESPRVVRLTTNEALTSNRTRAVVEDRFGRIYIGNDLGVDVLDAAQTQIRHYGVEDGLPHPFVGIAHVAANGDLWFGTFDGIARLTPTPAEPEPETARVLIDRIRAAGVAVPIPASGTHEVAGIVLAPHQRNLEVEFVALPRGLSKTLRFQYRLSDTEPWSPASSNRSIVLAGLSAGDRRLQIRALQAGGAPSPQVAVVGFRVVAPIHERGWFLALIVVAVFSALSVVYRLRVAHVTALERQRTRIAMDLHDEMGSRLGSIGLLADLAAEEAAPGAPQRARLEHIAETAAEMGSSMAEIVWSLRFGTMTLESVAQHLAVHGRRLFSGAPPVFETRFPDRWPAAEMSPAASRAVVLIGLEALHNAARHARAESVTLELRPSGRDWMLSVSDDGRGTLESPSASPPHGFGLETMRRRAAEIGGWLAFESQPDQGTIVRLTFHPRATQQWRRYRMNIRGIWNRRRGIFERERAPAGTKPLE